LLDAVDDDRLVAMPREHVYQRVPVAIATYQHLMTNGDVGDGPSVVDGVMTHPYLRDRRGRRFNDDYVAPDEFLRSLGSSIPAPSITLATYQLGAKSELADMRADMDTTLTGTGMHADARTSCLVTVGELTANSFLHGVPPVDVVLSRAGDDQLVLDVTDRGIGFDDPFFGYVQGSPEGLPTDGRGLWMVRHLCTALEASHMSEGFLVRASFDERQPRFRDLLPG
jgi:hypothetical protein